MKSLPSCNTHRAPSLTLYPTLDIVNIIFPQESVKKEKAQYYFVLLLLYDVAEWEVISTLYFQITQIFEGGPQLKL